MIHANLLNEFALELDFVHQKFRPFLTIFEEFFSSIPMPINGLLRKHYRKFFLQSASCLDARHEIKNCSFG